MSLLDRQKLSPSGRSWFALLPLPLPEDKHTGWKAYPVYHGRTRCMMDLGCHVSVLSPGVSPHAPHKHREEELLFLLAGEADLLIADDPSSRTLTVHKVRPGAFVYYPDGQSHSLRNSGDQPAAYLMFKWLGIPRRGGKVPAETAIFHLENPMDYSWDSDPNRIISKTIFQGPTRFLENLHCEIAILPPRCEIQSFQKGCDSAVLVLRGAVVAMGQTVDSAGLIFFSAADSKVMRNIGQLPAVCLIFHFLGCGKGWSFAAEGRRFLRRTANIKKKLFG